MARPLRIDIENGLDHVASRGWERQLKRLMAGLRSSENITQVMWPSEVILE